MGHRTQKGDQHIAPMLTTSFGQITVVRVTLGWSGLKALNPESIVSTRMLLKTIWACGPDRASWVPWAHCQGPKCLFKVRKWVPQPPTLSERMYSYQSSIFMNTLGPMSMYVGDELGDELWAWAMSWAIV